MNIIERQTGRKMTDKELCEIDAKDFLGEEDWRRQLAALEESNARRNQRQKQLRGPPGEADALLNAADAMIARSAKCMLYHSARMAHRGRCVCPDCSEKRQ